MRSIILHTLLLEASQQWHSLPHCAYLLVLVGCHCYKLGFWEGVAGDHPLRATHPHYVNAGLVLVQGVQHDLRTNRAGEQCQMLPGTKGTRVLNYPSFHQRWKRQ